MILCNTTSDFFTFSSTISGNAYGSIELHGVYKYIIDTIQCNVKYDNCFTPDFVDTKLVCHDNCLNHCRLKLEENLLLYIVLLFIIIIILGAIVYYIDNLLYKIK